MHFKMETMNSILTMINLGFYLEKVVIKDTMKTCFCFRHTLLYRVDHKNIPIFLWQ